MLDEGVNRLVVLGTLIVLAGSFGFVVRKVVAARRRPFASGREDLIGVAGTVREPLSPEGLVFVDGALWRASSGGPTLDRGTQVRIVAVEGLRLTVQPLDTAKPAEGQGTRPDTGEHPRGRRRWPLRRRTSWSPH
jgi:membrane-bound serine protease (ClpP class)